MKIYEEEELDETKSCVDILSIFMYHFFFLLVGVTTVFARTRSWGGGACNRSKSSRC